MSTAAVAPGLRRAYPLRMERGGQNGMHKAANWATVRLRRHRRPTLVLAALLAWPGLAQAEVTVTPAGKGFDIDVVGQASTTEVLEAIAGATGVEIKGTPGDATFTENHLRGASLERAISALLPHAGFVVSSDADGKPTAIIFMAASPDGGAPPPPDGAAAEPPADGIAAPPDGGIPDASVPDGSVPDGAAPDAASSDPAVPQESLPEGSGESAPDGQPVGTQQGGTGG